MPARDRRAREQFRRPSLAAVGTPRLAGTPGVLRRASLDSSQLYATKNTAPVAQLRAGVGSSCCRANTSARTGRRSTIEPSWLSSPEENYHINMYEKLRDSIKRRRKPKDDAPQNQEESAHGAHENPMAQSISEPELGAVGGSNLGTGGDNVPGITVSPPESPKAPGELPNILLDTLAVPLQVLPYGSQAR